MDPIEDFFRRLLFDGKIVLPDQPPSVSRQLLTSLLDRAFERHRLEVAGPAIEMDRVVALRAAAILWHASWALIHRDGSPEDLLEKLRLSGPPKTAAQHLSADVMFRYLPQIHRRSRGMDPSDALTQGLAELFRQWPLSGVLSDLDEGPCTPPDFFGHPGLMLLYSERLARHERIAWRPADPTIPYLELVLNELGRKRSPLLVRCGVES